MGQERGGGGLVQVVVMEAVVRGHVPGTEVTDFITGLNTG